MTINKLISVLLQWVSLNTNYDISKFDSTVKIVNERVIQKLVCGGKCPVLAFYSQKTGILITNMDLDNFCNQSILLHEMIHSFQVNKNMENAFKEKEAYQLQNKFLEEMSTINGIVKILNVKRCRSYQMN
ncbi:MAG: hypothetical protein ACJ0G4_06725 [Alphaproteobacteria bacterium]|tara:strand:- start:1198 stop:1587 length:390 start_codon:yes stop_codon:yes gene_type:complete